MLFAALPTSALADPILLLLMPLSIPDRVLQQMGLSEREALVEVACRLFDANKLGKADAGSMCGLSRVEFEAELLARGLPLVHIDEEWIEQERRSLEVFSRPDAERLAG